MIPSLHRLFLLMGISASTLSFAQNVGINTDGSNPDGDAILHIKNDAASGKDSSVVRIENAQNGANDVTGVEIYNSGTGATAKWDVYIPASGSTDLRFKNNGTDRITLQNDGDVGIGTTSPVSGLEVNTSLGYKVTTINSATTLDNTYNVILCNNGPYTVTLPSASANTGRVYRIKNIDAQSDVITIDGNGSETIDGNLTYALQPYQYSITLISDGANWHVIEFFTSVVSPTASAGAALSAICQSETSAAMVGSVGGSATGGTWTGGAGTWTNATNPSTATYTADASESGNITLTLTTSGGSFGTTTATKTITVNATNTAGAASSTPTLCINTALTNITHTTTGATGIGAATGLPAGVTAAWASNTITISGTPTASGTFNYSIPLTGGCGSVNATGTITVTAANTAGAASSTPTLDVNTALTDITHTTTGATGIGSATGLPAGVTAAWASNTITISGTPTEDGTFNYSIPLTGGCGSVNATGTITVNAAFSCGTSTVTFTYNGGSVTYGTVLSSTGKCWMDRNLGASQVATSSTDHLAYGDLFQWGRGADGHQLITWTNSTTGTGVNGTTNTVSTTDDPGHGDFITQTNWRNPLNGTLWQGVSGTNNPCPSGFRLPSDAEMIAEYATWSTSNSSGAFGSNLKLPMAGNRLAWNGVVSPGSYGRYWTDYWDGAASKSLFFDVTTVNTSIGNTGFGNAIRCIKD